MNTQTTTEKQILENNQLIRQFMGLSPKPQSPDVYSYSDGIFYSVRGSIEECIEGMNKYVKYHTSWDWLMPVVEKIELMNKETGFMGTFTLFGQGRTKVKCYIKENLKHEIDILSERYGIAPTYKAVVEFIQWYNTEKAKQVYPKSIGPINQNPEFYVNFFTDILETKCFNAVQTPEACKHLLNYAENKLIEANLNKA